MSDAGSFATSNGPSALVAPSAVTAGSPAASPTDGSGATPPATTAASGPVRPAVTPTDCGPGTDDPSGFTAIAIPDYEKIGQRGSETILNVACGFTCKFSLTWPSGASQSGLPPHTIVNGDGGRWTWTWTVPSSAGAGKATFALGCSAPGHINPSVTGSFTVVGAPTPTPKPAPSATENTTWTLDATVDSPLATHEGPDVTFNVTISKLAAGHEAYCEFQLRDPSKDQYSVSLGVASLGNGTTTVTRQSNYTANPGTWDWWVDCSNFAGSNYVLVVQGTVEVP